MSGKSKKKPSHDMSMTKAIGNALIIFMWAFVSEFSPSDEMFDRLRAEIESVRDSVLCGALAIPQIKKALKDDYNVEVF